MSEEDDIFCYEPCKLLFQIGDAACIRCGKLRYSDAQTKFGEGNPHKVPCVGVEDTAKVKKE